MGTVPDDAVGCEPSKDQYHLFADHSWEWETWVGSDGACLHCSPSSVRLTGYAPADFIADPDLPYKLVHPDDQAAFEQHRREALGPAPPAQMDVRIIRRDGALRWISHCCIPVFTEQGEFLGRRVTCRDITGRKRAEEESARLLGQVQAERQRLFSVLSMFPAYVVLLAPTHEAKFTNQKFTELFGEATPGQKCYNLLFGRDEPCEGCQSFNCLETGEPYIWEWTGPDGRIFEVYDYPFVDVDGARLVLEVGFDVSERKRNEQELQQHRDDLEDLVRERAADLAASEQKYRELVENAGSAIVHWRPDGTITFANQYCEQLYGCGPGELVGANVRDHISAVDEEGLPVGALLDAIVAAPQSFAAIEVENVTRDGRRLWMAWSNRAIYDEQGKLEATMSIGTDRTAQHAAQRQVEAQQQRLRMLATELALAEQREREVIATWLHDDIAQALVLAKMKLGFVKMMSSPEEVDEALLAVAGLLAEAIQSIRNVNLELSPTILFERGLAEAVEWAARRASDRHGYEVSVVVRGESTRLGRDPQVIVFQAVKELLSNAGKHAQASRVDIAVEYEAEDCSITVADDGVGFDATAVGADQTGGFGLLNVRERLESIGGKLTIESSPAQGSRFTLCVPVTGHLLPTTASRG